MEILCRYCKQSGFPSIYIDGCTSCANTIRFGQSIPTSADIENAKRGKEKMGLSDFEYAKYKQGLTQKKC